MPIRSEPIRLYKGNEFNLIIAIYGISAVVAVVVGVYLAFAV